MTLKAAWIGDEFFFICNESKCTTRTHDMIGSNEGRKYINAQAWKHGGATKSQETFPQHSTIGAAATLATDLPCSALYVVATDLQPVVAKGHRGQSHAE